MPDVPERLRRNGRPIDPVFEPTERLYRACELLEVAGDRLVPDSISFRDWSVNRGKYSEPQDVLLPRAGLGIATFEAGDVPATLTSESGIVFQFQLDHDPEDDNYSHSRIIVGRDGTFDAHLKVGKLVGKQFRLTLSDRTTVLQAPQV